MLRQRRAQLGAPTAAHPPLLAASTLMSPSYCGSRADPQPTATEGCTDDVMHLQTLLRPPQMPAHPPLPLATQASAGHRPARATWHFSLQGSKRGRKLQKYSVLKTTRRPSGVSWMGTVLHREMWRSGHVHPPRASNLPTGTRHGETQCVRRKQAG